MEQLTTNGSDFEMSGVKIAIPHQVMIEKWMLVLLIVGGTSLLFIICFPIDFYLYRRRKRLAREGKSTIMCTPKTTPKRAAQNHAKVTVTKVSAEIDYNEINEIEQRKYRAQRGVSRFLSMLKKKTNVQRLEFQEHLEETSLSEGSLDLRVNTSVEMETTNNPKNFYPETNKNVHNNINCVNDNTGTSKEKRIYRNLYDDDYFEYSTKKQFSNVSKALDENQEFFTYKKKKSHLRSRYDTKMSKLGVSYEKKKSNIGVHRVKKTSRSGALEPLENTTNVLGETSNKKCFTIPIRSRNDEHLEQVGENFKEVTDNKGQKEIAVEMDTDSFTTKLSGVDTGAVLTSGDKNRGIVWTGASKDISIDTAMLFQTGDKRFKDHKMLTHSQSDQCINTDFRHSKSSLRKKSNVISPVRENAFNFSEEIDNGGGEDNLIKRTKHISPSILPDYSLTPKVKRTKRYPFWTKQCSDSMLELHYSKEKY